MLMIEQIIYEIQYQIGINQQWNHPVIILELNNQAFIIQLHSNITMGLYVHRLMILISLMRLCSFYNNFNELREDMQSRVARISSAIQKIYQERCLEQTFQCPAKSYNICEGTGERQCLQNFPTSSQCDGLMKYSFMSGVRIPNSFANYNLSEDIKYFFCKTAEPQFQNVFQQLIKQNQKRYAWVAFGSNSGGHRVSPGFKYQKQKSTQSCKNYDPRLRPWFSSNAYQRKKMIILIQNSKGIHDRPNRYPSMQMSLQALLRTAEAGDFFNVIQFSDRPRAMFAQEQLKLVSISEQIQKHDKSTLRQGSFYYDLSHNITKSRNSDADYKQALQMAVQILQNSRHQNPQLQNLILMFVGFKPTNYSATLHTDIEDLLTNKQQDLKMNFLFFGFGVNLVDPQGVSLMSSLACKFDGIYFPLSDVTYESMFLDQAPGFYEYLSQGNEIEGERWTGFYLDAFGLGKMVSVLKPAYYIENNVTRLIGFAVVDVLTSQLTIYKPQAQIMKQLQITELPFRKNISICALQTIRRNYKCFNPAMMNCPQQDFCRPRLTATEYSVLRAPLDTTDDSCCAFQEGANLGLVLGLTIGISLVVLSVLVLVFIFVIKKSKNQATLQTYTEIYSKFNDFDHSRIRSQSQISLIKE